MRKRYLLIIFALLTRVHYGQTHAQSSYEEVITSARANYENGSYAQAVTQLETILPYLEGRAALDAQILLAFNYVAIGDEMSAIEHFKVALTQDPELTLDEYETTPEIIAVFNEAAQEQAYEYAGCSCFIPGIGQILKGDYKKGRAIIATSAITLVGTMISWSVADGKRSNYLSIGPENLDKIEEAYDDYNRWRKITLISASAFLGVYVYSIVDAMISRSPAKKKKPEQPSGIEFRFEDGTTSIGYVFKL